MRDSSGATLTLPREPATVIQLPLWPSDDLDPIGPGGMQARAPKRSGRRRFYSNTELLSRPLEHVLEELSAREIGEALGLGHDTGNQIQRGLRRLEPVEELRIRQYLEAVVA